MRPSRRRRRSLRGHARGGRRIVLTAPLTEIIDHAGYFIQMKRLPGSFP
jgi:hypothetical protein